MQKYTRSRRWTLVSVLALTVTAVAFLGTSGARPPGPTPTGGIPAVLADTAALKARIDQLEAQQAAILEAIKRLAIDLRVDCGAPPDLVAVITSCGETAVVRNVGGSTAGASTTRVTVNGVSTDIATPALDPGDEFPITLTCKFTPDCSIEVDADIFNVVGESDETNNDDSCDIIG